MEIFFRRDTSNLEIIMKLQDNSLVDEHNRTYNVTTVTLLFSTPKCKDILKAAKDSEINNISKKSPYKHSIIFLLVQLSAASDIYYTVYLSIFAII